MIIFMTYHAKIFFNIGILKFSYLNIVLFDIIKAISAIIDITKKASS